MKGCISCKEAMRQCMDTHTFAFAHLYNDEKAMDMHIHDCYEISVSRNGYASSASPFSGGADAV